MTPDIQQKLIEFAQWAICEHHSELGDLDGASLQDKLVELGLLVEVHVTEPCGEDCRCAEWDDFPQECLRLVDGVNL